jgi:peptidoglycan/LPS O-acetylase OafA/YrhL
VRRTGHGTADQVDAAHLGYRKALDGIRGVAVLLVLLYHLPLGVPNVGHVGVMMFFALSGFLITTLLLEERHTFARIDLPQFYRRRALRLLPALIAVLTVIVALDLIVGSQAGYRRPALFALFYVANWAIIGGVDFHHINHTWSLAIEEHFYLLWPLTLVLVLRNHEKKILLWIAVAGAVASWGLRVSLWASGASLPRIIYATDTRLDSLLIGCIFAIVGWQSIQRVPHVVTGAALATFAIVIVIPDHWFQFAIGFTAVPVATVIIIAGCLTSRGAWTVLGHRPLAPIGRISYGLYLWHLPIYGFVFKYGAGLPRAAQSIGAVLLSFAVASLSFRFVERPFLRLKRRRTGSAAPTT